MLTIAAMPNTKFTSWSVAAFDDGGSTNFFHFKSGLTREEAEDLAYRARALLDLQPPAKGSHHDYSETPAFPRTVGSGDDAILVLREPSVG